jgi:outer membrane murein-binding lipoprotein Lpp
MRPKQVFLAAMILGGCLISGIVNGQDEARLEARAKIKRVQARKNENK